MRLNIAIVAAALVSLATPRSAAGAQQINPCRANQLAVRTHGMAAAAGHEATAFDISNKSRSACSVGGVPKLVFLDADKRVPLSVCANCADFLFRAQPAEALTLQSGDSAHFLIGYTSELPDHISCRVVLQAQVFFGNDPLVLSLFRKDPYPPGDSYSAADTLTICNPNVSAWRMGLFRPGRRE